MILRRVLTLAGAVPACAFLIATAAAQTAPQTATDSDTGAVVR